MAKTALDLKPDEWQAYHLGAVIRQRQMLTEGTMQPRWELAQRVARKAAKRLREEFGARRIVLFGSAVEASSFTRWSDVDLGVWGVAPESFYAAVGAVTSLSTEISVDLVDPDQCPPALQNVIERDGIEL
jgi:predicted nucleotidyltransferase